MLCLLSLCTSVSHRAAEPGDGRSHADISAWGTSRRYVARARCAASRQSPHVRGLRARRHTFPACRSPATASPASSLPGRLVACPQLRCGTSGSPHHKRISAAVHRELSVGLDRTRHLDACCEDARCAPFAVVTAPSDQEVRTVPPRQQRSALGVHVDGVLREVDGDPARMSDRGLPASRRRHSLREQRPRAGAAGVIVGLGGMVEAITRGGGSGIRDAPLYVTTAAPPAPTAKRSLWSPPVLPRRPQGGDPRDVVAVLWPVIAT